MPIHQLRQIHCTMNISTEDITCQECGKSFSERSVFNKHFRQYHKKNESDCLVCGINFLLSSCWRATLQGLIQMWSVTYVTKLWRKMGWVSTNKHTSCLKLVSEGHKMMLAASSPFEATRIYQGMRVLKMYQLGKGMLPNLLKPIISLATLYTL